MSDAFRGRGRWLIAAAVLGLGLTLGFGLFSDDPSHIVTPRANAFSRSVLGHHALVAFLKEMGLTVQVSRYQTETRLSQDAALVLLSPATEGEGLERAVELVAQARDLGVPTVLVLPKWRLAAVDPFRPGWMGGVDWLETTAVEVALETMLEMEKDTGPVLSYLGSLSAGSAGFSGGLASDLAPELPASQLLEDDEFLQPLLHRRGATLIAQVGNEPLWVVSDPDLVNNGGLGLGDNAALFHRLLVQEMGVRAVIVDETHHGFLHPPSVWRELTTFPLSLVSLHLLALLGAVVWAAGRRFGRPRPVPPRVQPGLGTLIDNTARLVHRAGRTADTLERYFRLTVRHAARQCALPPNLGFEEQIYRLRQVGQSRGIQRDQRRDLGRLASRVQAQRGSPDRPQTAQQTLQLCRELAAWRKEITDGLR